MPQTKIKTKKKAESISIIVVSYHNAPVLELCINSILKERRELRRKQDLKMEVLVIDSEASEKTRDIAKKFTLQRKPVRYFPFTENTGFSRAVNKGIKESRGDFLLILNYDIILTEGALLRMVEVIKNDKKIGIMGPKLLNFDGSPQSSAFHFYTPLVILYRRTPLGKTPWGKKKLSDFIISLDKETEKPIAIDGWLMGSALMLRRDNLEKVGVMDERYFMYFEDVDWCRRFQEKGFKVIYFPGASLFHYHGKKSATRHFWEVFFNKMTLVHIESAVKYFWKFRKK